MTHLPPGGPPSSPRPPSPPVPPGVADDVAGWHRLHPLSPLVRAGRHLVTIGILVLVLLFANQNQAGGDLIVDLVIVAVVLAGGVVSWLVTRWQVADGVLRIDTGLIRRESRRFPLSQVQAIDVVQTGLARVLGLADIRLRMAGADSSGGRLACLPLADAEQLRERLLSMARAPGTAAAGKPAAPYRVASPDVPSGPPGAARLPERVLFRVDSGRLAGAITLSRAGAFAAIVVAAMASVVALAGQTRTIAPFLPVGLGIVLAVWRQFNGEYGTVVAAAPDGLRLRSGLVQTTAETIRPGRVQAVRLVEPLVWRAFGWCRLEVDVAGPRQRRENRSESQRLRALIPVGSSSDHRARDRRAAGHATAAVAAGAAERPLEGAVDVPLPGVGSRRPLCGGLVRPGVPEDHLGPAGEGAEHPLGAGPSPAPARACVGTARRRGQAGEREHPGPRRRRSARNLRIAARPRP